MASADGESICETCREIDFHHLLHHARYDHPRFASLYPSIPQNVRYSPDCKLCSLISSGTPLDHLGKMFELGSFFNAAATGIVRSTIELRIFLPNRIGRFTSPSGAVFCRLASDVSQSLGCVQPADLSTIKPSKLGTPAWLDCWVPLLQLSLIGLVG
jgi:hypothetical protein